MSSTKVLRNRMNHAVVVFICIKFDSDWTQINSVT